MKISTCFSRNSKHITQYCAGMCEFLLNRPFPNYLRPLFQSESRCSSFIFKSIFIHMKMSLICALMKIDLHTKVWAPGLALKKKPEVIRKWPIQCAIPHPRTLSEALYNTKSCSQIKRNPETKTVMPINWPCLIFLKRTMILFYGHANEACCSCLWRSNPW